LSPTEIHGKTYVASPADFSNNPLYYSELKNPKNFTIGATFGNRFGKNKKFGLLLSGSYQDIHSGTQSTLFLPNAQPGLDNIPQFVDLYSRKYSTNNQRIGLNAKIDYKFNKKNKISLLNTFVRLDAMQVRLNYDTIALNSLLSESNRTSWQYQSVYNTTLQGQHQLTTSLLLDWSAGYSIANNHLPDLASFSHEYPVLIDATKGTVTKGTPDILGTMSRGWTHNDDKDHNASFNFTKQLKLANRFAEIKFGSLFRTRQRSNFYNSYSLNPLLPTGSSVQTFSSLQSAVFTFKGANATPSLNGNNYTFDEIIGAAYLQGKIDLTSSLEFLGGFRYEETHQKYNTELSPDVDARSGEIHYGDLLPSAQFKYKLNSSQALRLSYYQAIARPQFAELIPDGPDSYETFKERGNPQGLKHTLADNFDLRYELFPGNADQILLGTFYKRIVDPIEYNAVKTGVTSQSLIPTNIGTATNYGFEAVFTKYFGVLGVSANYTYTQSKVTNDSMLLSYRNTAGVRTSKYVSETRPLQGQANHIGNISLIYKNPKLGLDAQLAVVYTGERISLVSPYAGLHYWQQPITGLDFSFEKKIIKGLTFYGKLNNLTNSPIVVSLHIPYNTYILSSGSRALSMQAEPASKIIVQKDYLKSSFLFGLRYKL
jgi:outer membrane receptor protein involved in Fe transport